MTFDQLMRHAKDITDKAVLMEGQQQAVINAMTAGGGGVPAPVDYDRIRQKYAFVEQMFEPFSRLPDPASYDPLVAALNEAMGKLYNGSANNNELASDVSLANPHLDKMTTDGGYLQGWTGGAAITFKANFLDTFKTISGNQFTMLSTLKGALQAHREMWLKARDDIDKIAENTKHALDNAGGCGKNQWSFGFSVLSAVNAVTGVGITVATGGAGFAITLPAIGAAASVGSATVAGITASGDSAETIINSMKQAVDDLTGHIQKVETQDIAEPVRRLADAARGNRDRLVAARPDLAGMNDRDLTGDRGMGKPD